MHHPVKPVVDWKRKFNPNDRQLRKYCGEQYIPNWKAIKFIRHRGVNGSLTISRDQTGKLNEILLSKTRIREFKRVDVFITEKKTPIKAKILWLGNGAAVVTLDGFFVYEAVSVLEALRLDAGPGNSEDIRTELETIRKLDEVSQPAPVTVVNSVPEISRKEVSATHTTIDMRETLMNSPADTTPPSTKPHSVRKVDENTFIIDGQLYKKLGAEVLTNRKPVATLSEEEKLKGLFLELRIGNQITQNVIGQLEKVQNLLQNALEQPGSGYGRALQRTSTIIFKVVLRGKTVFEKSYCAKDGHTVYKLNGISYVGQVPLSHVYQVTASMFLDVLSAIRTHGYFGEAVVAANNVFSLGDKTILHKIPARPESSESKEIRAILKAVYGTDEKGLHDVYTSMWHKLMHEKDYLDREASAAEQHEIGNQAAKLQTETVETQAIGDTAAAAAVVETAESVPQEIGKDEQNG